MVPRSRMRSSSVNRYHRTGRKRFHHPLVGDLELDFEALELPGDPGQRINVYTAPPDSPSQEALNLLASWTTRQPAATADTPERENTKHA
jgi:transcription regulator MmyB-like protein